MKVTIGSITYRVVAVHADFGEVPRELEDQVRWCVAARLVPHSPESIAGWITSDSGPRGAGRRGPGRWSCFAGGDDYLPSGPPLTYLRNVRLARRSGLPAIAAAYASWLTGDSQPAGGRNQ